MTGSCVVDADAVRRFGAVAQQAFRELDVAAGAVAGTAALLADLVPHSATVPQWCETACTAANLAQCSADCFGKLAEHAGFAVTGCVELDFGAANVLLGLEVRI